MKDKIITTIAVFCLLLTGCNGDNDSKADTDSTVTEATTSAVQDHPADISHEATTDMAVTSNTGKTIAQNEKKDPSENDISFDDVENNTDAAIIVIGDDSPAASAGKQSEAEIKTETEAEQTTENEKESGTKSDVSNGNVFMDDDLNWSPLVPVD